jgi:hypothetical protein
MTTATRDARQHGLRLFRTLAESALRRWLAGAFNVDPAHLVVDALPIGDVPLHDPKALAASYAVGIGNGFIVEADVFAGGTVLVNAMRFEGTPEGPALVPIWAREGKLSSAGVDWITHTPEGGVVQYLKPAIEDTLSSRGSTVVVDLAQVVYSIKH